MYAEISVGLAFGQLFYNLQASHVRPVHFEIIQPHLWASASLSWVIHKIHADTHQRPLDGGVTHI